jgi:predicted DCC family thiol-disulfide oxidoreductase YuxK
MTTLPTELALVFDGTCGFCTRSVYVLQRFDHAGRISIYPFQAPGVRERFGLSLEDCERAAWAIAPDGRRFGGAAAINMALAVALGVPLPMLFYVLPGMQQLQDVTYTLVARNRSKLPGVTPYCVAHPAACGLAVAADAS